MSVLSKRYNTSWRAGPKVVVSELSGNWRFGAGLGEKGDFGLGSDLEKGSRGEFV